MRHGITIWETEFPFEKGVWDYMIHYAIQILLCYAIFSQIYSCFPTPAWFTWDLNCEVESAKKEKQLAAF